MSGELKPFSCLVCRQRKVRCDRTSPCANCTRAEIACEYVAPVRGKRKRTKPPREGLHAKVRRYEELLKLRGISLHDVSQGDEEEDAAGDAVDPSDEDMSEGHSDTESPSTISSKAPGATEPIVGFRTAFITHPNSQPKLVDKEGSTRYYEHSTLWSTIGEEFRHPDEFAEPDDDDTGEPENDLFLGGGFSDRGFNGSLRDYHPSIQCLRALKDIFVERIDPLVKIIHIPTFWVSLQQAAERRPDLPKDMAAVIFCFYFATASVLEDSECEKLFGANKKAVFAKYRAIARYTLRKADVLCTTSPMTLRAFCFFMMGLRGHLRHDAQFILCGISVRLAQKMGLHRDGKCLGLSLFETEMRRRLWFHIAHQDFRTADLLGTKPSLDTYMGDVKTPWNAEDEDLYPEMRVPPKDRKAITPITMTLVRCDIKTALTRLSGQQPKDVSWGTIGVESDLPTEEKDKLIDEIEDNFESKYLRYCDPTRSLDLLVSCMVRAAVCNMRLFAHNPRRFADAGGQVSEGERNLAFKNATKLLEYASLVGENKSLRKYEWRVNTTYLWDKILFVLIEARHRRLGADVDRLWDLIGRVFSQYPDAFGEASASLVYTALSRWTLEVWDGYLAARSGEGMEAPEEPAYITAMRVRQRSREEAAAEKARLKQEEEAAQGKAQEVPNEGFPNAAFGGFSNLETFELNLDEWMNWEQLVSEQTGFPPVEGY